MIYTPPSLNTADTILNLADSLVKLLDPKERGKIADEIKAHHALNDTEAKKHAEAISLIEKHKSILEETQRIASKVSADQKKLDTERAVLAAAIADNNVKHAEKLSGLEEKKKENQAILEEAAKKEADITARE